MSMVPTKKSPAKGGGLRRVLKILLTTLVLLLLVLVCAFMALFYNPFQGSFGQVTRAVPANVDFYLRKEKLGADFADFPTPEGWEELAATDALIEFKGGPTLAAWDRWLKRSRADNQGIRECLAQVRRELDRAPIDLFANLAATDLALAGQLQGTTLEQSAWCLYTRVGWKVCAALNGLSYAFVRGWLPPEIEVTPADSLYRVEVRGGSRLWLAHRQDLMLLGNHESLVRRSLALARGEGQEDALGDSADYEDGVIKAKRGFFGTVGEGEELDRDEKERIELLTSELEGEQPIEFFFNTQRLFSRHPGWAGWPDPESPAFLERAGSIFLTLGSWRRVCGFLMRQGDSTALGFDEGRATGTLSLSATLELDRNRLGTMVQRSLLELKPEPNRLFLDRLAKVTPRRAAVVAALRLPVESSLRELFDVLEPAAKEELLEAISYTGRFAGVDQFVEAYFSGLLPRVGIVVRANDYKPLPDSEIPPPTSVDPRPFPAVALVFWTRPGELGRVQRFEKLMVQYATRWGFKEPINLIAGPGQQYWIRELHNPQISGTGCLALLVRKGYMRGSTEMIVANSGRLVAEMVDAKFRQGGERGRPLDLTGPWRALENLLPASSSGLVYVNGAELAGIMEAWESVWLREAGGNREQFFERVLARYEAELLRGRYARYASRQAMPEAVKRRFDEEVRARMDAAWREEAGRRRRGEAPRIKELVSFFRLLRSAYLHLDCSPRAIKVRGRAWLEVE